MEIRNPSHHKKNRFFRFRPLFRWIIRLRSSSRAIAGGLGLGAFIAFSPTYGIQIFLALFLATAFNCNRAATLIPIWVTNPVTIVPVYSFNYWLGTFFWEGPEISQVSRQLMDIAKELARLDFFAVFDQFALFLHLGRDVVIPLIVGSLITGLVAGILVYILSLRLLTWLNSHRKRKKKPR